MENFEPEEELSHSLKQTQEREAEASVREEDARRSRSPASSRAAAQGSKPMLVVADSGSVSFRRIEHELKKRYDKDYQVVSIPSSKWGIKRLREFKAAGQEMALVLADQWMPDMSGTEFVAQA